MGLSRGKEKMIKLSERLFELRDTGKLTQEETAKQMGIAYRTYRRYEAGEREPTVSMLIKMADFYEVTIDYLVGRTEQKC